MCYNSYVTIWFFKSIEVNKRKYLKYEGIKMSNQEKNQSDYQNNQGNYSKDCSNNYQSSNQNDNSQRKNKNEKNVLIVIIVILMLIILVMGLFIIIKNETGMQTKHSSKHIPEKIEEVKHEETEDKKEYKTEVIVPESSPAPEEKKSNGDSNPDKNPKKDGKIEEETPKTEYKKKENTTNDKQEKTTRTVEGIYETFNYTEASGKEIILKATTNRETIYCPEELKGITYDWDFGAFVTLIVDEKNNLVKLQSYSDSPPSTFVRTIIGTVNYTHKDLSSVVTNGDIVIKTEDGFEFIEVSEEFYNVLYFQPGKPITVEIDGEDNLLRLISYNPY